MTHLEILAHRGTWRDPDDRNSPQALRRALSAGYGIETDVRDLAGELVISHDMATRECEPLASLLADYAAAGWKGTLALNIKADGLAGSIEDLLVRYDIVNYFVFDMSVPDTLDYLKRGLKIFTRRSEYERGSLLDDRANGLWLDAFVEPFASLSDVIAGTDSHPSCALVSPELHRRPHMPAWEAWRAGLLQKAKKSSVMLCTDFPDDAAAFFEGPSI